MNLCGCTVLEHQEAYCFSRTDFITTTGSLFLVEFPFYRRPWCAISHRGLQLASIATTLTAGFNEKPWHQYDLFIRTVDGSGLESATANQWPLGRERILNDKLNPTSPQ